MKTKSNRTYSTYQINSGFNFRPVGYEEVLTELKKLDMSKATQLEGIPTKIVKENRDDKHDKSNYRPVSILTILSKIYEKCLYKQIENYMEFDYTLSNFQCGFRKGFNTQQCHRDEKAKTMDEDGHFSALLTDISKAFDCLPHDLLIAKLDAYGFKNDAHYLIFNYLDNRKSKNKLTLQLFSKHNQ